MLITCATGLVEGVRLGRISDGTTFGNDRGDVVREGNALALLF